MKISKVNHTRAAVSAHQRHAKGILYKYPVMEEKGEQVRPTVSEFDDHFDEINETAKDRYRILSPEVKGKKYGRVPKKLRSKIDLFIKKLVRFNGNVDEEIVIERQMEFLEGHSEDIDQCIFRYKGKLYIHALVTAYLRKSLRKNVVIGGSVPVKKCYLPSVAEKVIKALCVTPKTASKEERADKYRVSIAAIDREELKTFLKSLNIDYTRSRQKQFIKKSIENQNVKASVILKDKLYLLQPSYANHKKRQAIYDFMLRYVEGNEEERDDLLSYMRGLIVLYICGTEIFSELQESGTILKDFAAPFIGAELVFCEDASAIFREDEPKALKKRLRAVYEYELVRHYQQALGVFEREAEKKFSIGMSDDERKDAIKKAVMKEAFWLDFIEQEVKGIIDLSKPDNEYKNNALYLCRKVWKRWTAFMAEKYIDLGKAVYHFAMPSMPLDKNAPVKVGTVREEYQDGLTSFDYEHIKAVENMERSVSIAVTFAVNNFSRATYETVSGNTTDVLFLKKEKIEESLYGDTGSRILRYFGGASRWKDNVVVRDSAMGRGDDLFLEIREQLQSLRNGSYHYTQKFDDTEPYIVPAMLESEKTWLGPIIRKKYHSNNTHWFYPKEKLYSLINALYRAPAVRGDQVPAFARLFNREKLYNEERIFTPTKRAEIGRLGSEKVDIFKGAAFFVFKEIYYYDFLKDQGMAKKFRELVFDIDVPCENIRALVNFRNRINDIRPNASMGEIAQMIMTDYDLQNRRKETSQIFSSATSKVNKEKYKSFPMILYRYMKLTFLDFLDNNKEKYGFLFVPVEQENYLDIKEDDFCNIKAGPAEMMFEGLSLRSEGNKSTAPWYVLGHMISPTHLNHLSGHLRSYIRYLKDIDNRANQTGNKNPAVYNADQHETAYFERVLEVLEFCRFFCGRISNEATDYYTDGQYAAEIFKYVDAERFLGEAEGISAEQVLVAFCNQETGSKKADGTSEKIGLYYDDQNVILNRNILLASLYGTDRIIQNAVDKVSEKDIMGYYRLKNTLLKEETGEEKKDAEEYFKKRRELQCRKNHVELVNVKKYSDILNDLMTQLVSWAYFRERDMLYLSLGAQYLRIFFGKQIGAGSPLRKLSWPNVVNIQEGAVLYQIVAMYTYHLPFYQVTYDEAGSDIIDVTECVGMYGVKEGPFKKYCRSKEIFKPILYFFEVEKDHDKIRELRNYIDHFSYFVKADRNILALYSDIYNIFFSYSENFRKSVTFILPNILSKYFVLTGVQLKQKKREVLNSNNVHVMRRCAEIDTDKELKSYQFTYNVVKEVDESKYDEDKKRVAGRKAKEKQKKDSSADLKKITVPVKGDALDERFLKDLNKILHYQESQQCKKLKNKKG